MFKVKITGLRRKKNESLTVKPGVVGHKICKKKNKKKKIKDQPQSNDVAIFMLCIFLVT